jgi:hypothetical protein
MIGSSKFCRTWQDSGLKHGNEGSTPSPSTMRM